MERNLPTTVAADADQPPSEWLVDVPNRILNLWRYANHYDLRTTPQCIHVDFAGRRVVATDGLVLCEVAMPSYWPHMNVAVNLSCERLFQVQKEADGDVVLRIKTNPLTFWLVSSRGIFHSEVEWPQIDVKFPNVDFVLRQAAESSIPFQVSIIRRAFSGHVVDGGDGEIGCVRSKGTAFLTFKSHGVRICAMGALHRDFSKPTLIPRKDLATERYHAARATRRRAFPTRGFKGKSSRAKTAAPR